MVTADFIRPIIRKFHCKILGEYSLPVAAGFFGAILKVEQDGFWKGWSGK
jgi:hypothetical protein